MLSFARYINIKHKNLKLTIYFKHNNSFHFLNAKITRESKGFLFSVFCKSPFGEVFTDLNRPYFYITILLFHNFLSSAKSLFRNQLRQTFKCNNYPVALIYQCVKTFLNKIFVPRRTLITVHKVILIVLTLAHLFRTTSWTYSSVLPILIPSNISRNSSTLKFE